jgi:hypothetical protein
MLNHLLTATLEAVILLDILGVVVYFVVSGIVRSRKQPTVQPSIIPAGPPGYAPFPSSIPYASPSLPDDTSSPRGWPGLRNLKDRITHRREPAPLRAEASDVEAEQRRIGVILNSFKEDV